MALPDSVPLPSSGAVDVSETIGGKAVHPLCTLFPAMDSASYATFRDDIRANGLHEAIWLYDGQIIDGRHRAQACAEVGVAPRYRTWDGQGSLVDFVISANEKRRHLTPSQRAAIAVDVLYAQEIERWIGIQDYGTPADWKDVVYVIGHRPERLVKIGHSHDVQKRLAAMQPHSPHPLSLWWTTPGGRALESTIHRTFWPLRCHGEWYDFGDTNPIQRIQQAIAAYRRSWGVVASWPREVSYVG